MYQEGDAVDDNFLFISSPYEKFYSNTKKTRFIGFG